MTIHQHDRDKQRRSVLAEARQVLLEVIKERSKQGAGHFQSRVILQDVRNRIGLERYDDTGEQALLT